MKLKTTTTTMPIVKLTEESAGGTQDEDAVPAEGVLDRRGHEHRQERAENLRS